MTSKADAYAEALRSLEGLEIVKGHGTGNDFVLVPDPEARIDLDETAVQALTAKLIINIAKTILTSSEIDPQPTKCAACAPPGGAYPVPDATSAATSAWRGSVAPEDAPLVCLRRDAHLFSRHPEVAERLARERRLLPLAPDQLLHPVTPAGYLVRRGRLRVTQLLADGREITRAVLQAGAGLETRPGGAPDATGDTYPLTDVILTALGEAELWQVPAGSFDLT